MAQNSGSITLPVVTVQRRGHEFQIDTGETLFPGIVLLFCGIYYYNTRGLPAESMLYARPLLYVTALLAVTTLLSHAISIRTPTENRETSKKTPERSTEDEDDETVDKQTRSKESTSETEETITTREATPEKPDQEKFFSIRSAAELAVLTTAYILSLYVVPFVVATVLFLAGAVYLFGERSILRIVAYAGGFTLVLWLVFINWLLVPLP